MKISRNTRHARAGIKEAESLIEMVHLMYFKHHALEFLNTFTELVDREFERRKKEALEEEHK